MLIEGPTLVVEALASDLNVEAVYAEEGVVLPVALEALTEGPGRPPLERTQSGALSAVLPTINPQPVVAVVARPQWTLSDLRTDRPVLVLVEGRDPGNVGTLWRTAEAAGFAGVVLVADSVDPTNPKVIRASAGAAMRLPMVEVADIEGLFAALRAQGRRVIATALSHSARPHDRSDLRTAAIVLGNEAHGLPAPVIGASDDTVMIELAGPTESLNVAAAGAVLCFESLRQRRIDQPVPNNSSLRRD